MKGNPQKIKRFVGLMRTHGFSLVEVVCKEVGMSLTTLAEEANCRRTELSMMLNAHPHRLYPKLRLFIARKLRITDGELERLIDVWAECAESRTKRPAPKKSPSPKRRKKNA